MYYSHQHLQTTPINRMTKSIMMTLIALPIIDLLTAFSVSLALSAGIVIRMLALLILYGWLTFVLYRDNRLQLLFLHTMLVVLTIGFLINWSMKEPFFFIDEITFMAKTAYGVIVLFTVTYLLQYRRINLDVLLKMIPIAALIIGVSFWTAIFSGTSLSSYPYEKAGYSGWFYSANELGVILIVLLSLVLVTYQMHRSIASFLAIVILLSVLPMLGTKTPLYGGILIFVLDYSFTFFVSMRNKQWFQPIAFGVLLIVFSFTMPYTPFYENTVQVDHSPGMEETLEAPSIQQQMLSSRDIYLKETEKDFSTASWIQQLFGIGYGGQYKKSPKMVEMDGYDLLFGWGILGLIVYFALIISIFARIIHFTIDHRYVTLLACLIICGGISLVAGHVLFAPSVMTYIALLILCTGLLKKTNIANRAEVS